MAKSRRIIVINHYGITPDMPGATRNYDLAKFIADHTEFQTEFWRCSVGHYVKYKRLQNNKVKDYMDGRLKVRGIWSVAYKGNSVMRFANMILFDLSTGFLLLFNRHIEFVLLCVPPINFFNILVMKLRGIKLVVDVEDLWPLFLEDMGVSNKPLLTLLRHAANYTYRTATAISAVSEGMLSYVKNQVSMDSRVSWLSPLGVDLSDYSNPAPNKSLFLNYKWADSFVVMYIGAMGPANDLGAVLNTISVHNATYGDSLNEKKLAFVFIGQGSSRAELERLRLELDLSNVYFEEGIPACLVPHYLMRADICLTNLKKVESFKLVRPNKLFQYMAARKPILCGIWGEMQGIIEQSNCGVYIDFTNTRSACKALNAFLYRDDFHEMGERGFRYVSQHGNRVDIFAETVSILKGL